MLKIKLCLFPFLLFFCLGIFGVVQGRKSMGLPFAPGRHQCIFDLGGGIFRTNFFGRFSSNFEKTLDQFLLAHGCLHLFTMSKPGNQTA